MSLKILHLPTSVGGNSAGLAQGERLLGLDSKVMIMEENYLDYPYDFNLHLEGKSTKREKVNYLLEIMNEIKNKYDVFHFNYGTSLIDYGSLGMELYDLPFYPSKAKIIVTYNGCDARQKFETIKRVPYSACHFDECYDGHCMDVKIEEKRKRMIQKFSQYANHMFALNPDLLYFLPSTASFLPYTIANWNKIEDGKVGNKKKKIKILHAPTNRICKGSKFILSILARIKKEYKHHVHIELIEGKSHIDALKLYREADLVIDQILIGWYGAFAVEVMKMGKPVMVYLREEDFKFLPETMEKDIKETFINVNAFNLYEKLCEVIENRNLLERHSKKSIEYVHRWHDPIFVAKSAKHFYEEKIV